MDSFRLKRFAVASAVFATVAIVVSSVAVAPAHASKKGISLMFGGSVNPFGKAIKGHDNTRYRRHFGFAGNFRYLFPIGAEDNNLYFGGRLSVFHLRNDVRSGEAVIGTLGMFPVMVSAEVQKWSNTRRTSSTPISPLRT